MRPSLALLLPAVAGVAQAATASISGLVYGVGIERPSTLEDVNTTPMVITPKQLRLVLAGNLDLSQYHALGDDHDSSTVDAINYLDGRLLHSLSGSLDDTQRYLMVFRGGSEDIEDLTKPERAYTAAGHHFSLPESSLRIADLDRLIEDLKTQAAASSSDTIFEDYDISDHPFEEEEWRLMEKYRKNSQNIMLFINTDTIRDSQAPANALGSYSMPIAPAVKRQPESFRVSSSTSERDEKNVTTPLRKLPALCYASLDACTSATNNCSGHGECYRKYGPDKGASGAECFACGCVASFANEKTTYWGGAACQKEDVSAQFWILAGFSVLLMGLVGWAIGMMFSIGNEKLPGVIGAGVAPKMR